MIRLTNKAIKHFKDGLAANPSALGVSINIRKSGCSGNSYVLDFATEYCDLYQVIEVDGIKIFVEKNKMPLLVGMEIDYISDGCNTRIKMNNPNATGECGCGESFSVD